MCQQQGAVPELTGNGDVNMVFAFFAFQTNKLKPPDLKDFQ